MDITPTVPAIAAQSTLTGRRVHVAQVTTSDGHLLLPYGDYGANTGPIDVIGFDPNAGTLVTYFDNLTDERIEDYRVLNGGAIWTCITDPQNRDEAKVATNAGGAWHDVTIAVPGKGVAVHLFDIAQTSNGYLYACGARNFTDDEMVSQANLPNFNPDIEYNTGFFVWRSVDGGITWTEDFVDLKNNDGYYRPYGFGKIGDDLFVAASDGTGYWQMIGGVWSTKNTSPFLYISAPTIWSHDGTAFASSNVGNRVFTLSGSTLTQTLPYDGFNKAIASGPNGWLWFDNAGVLSYGDVVLGAVANWGTFRGVIAPDGAVYISDGTHIYRVTLPSGT